AESLLYELVTALTKSSLCESLVVAPDDGDLVVALCREGVPVALADYGWWCSEQPRVNRSPTLAAKHALHCARRLRPSARSVALALRDFSPDLVVSNTCVTPAGAIAAARMRV